MCCGNSEQKPMYVFVSGCVARQSRFLHGTCMELITRNLSSAPLFLGSSAAGEARKQQQNGTQEAAGFQRCAHTLQRCEVATGGAGRRRREA